jgi:hypothetical protein
LLSKKSFVSLNGLKILPYMPELVGFQTMVVLDPYVMTFDVVGVWSATVNQIGDSDMKTVFNVWV